MEFKEIEIELINYNNYNPNVMPKRIFKAMVDDLKERKELLQPILLNSNYVIIDGENRYNACKEAGFTKIPSIIAETDEDEAKLLTIKLNKVRGEYDLDLLTELLEDLNKNLDVDTISKKTSIYISDIYNLLGKYDNTEMNKKINKVVDNLIKPRFDTPKIEKDNTLNIFKSVGFDQEKNNTTPLITINDTISSKKSETRIEQPIEMRIECTLEELSIINKAINKIRRRDGFKGLTNGAILSKYFKEILNELWMIKIRLCRNAFRFW